MSRAEIVCPGGPAKPLRGAAFGIVLGIGLAIGLANMAKPVHIDDTLYVTIARQIVKHPLDPYGGTINWQQIPEPTYQVSISPPLLSYEYAIVLAVVGENIPLLHLVLVPWILLACWALFRLGERWADAGVSLSLLVVLGPAVVVGMNLMLDVPLLACMSAGVECMLRGMERRSARWTFAAGLLGATGVWVKFPALALVPLFVVAALQRRRWGPLLAAIGPIAALVLWQWASRSLYGASQVQTGLSFLGQFRSAFARQVTERTLTMFAIVAWTFPVWVLAPARLGRRGRIAAGLAALITIVLAATMLGTERWRSPWVCVAFLIGVGLGAYTFVACALPVSMQSKRADHSRPLLWAWILGVLVIVIPFGPFVAVRSFLPIQPPLALLLLSRGAAGRGLRGASIGLSAMLGLLLAAVDYRWAASYPATAHQLAARFHSIDRPVFFLGHWGWQYEAERAGFQPWDARRRDAPSGSIVIVPLRADRQWMHPDVLHRLRLRDRITIAANPLGLTTWNRAVGLRFYGGDYGELPWGFSKEPTEEFFVSEIEGRP